MISKNFYISFININYIKNINKYTTHKFKIIKKRFNILVINKITQRKLK